MKVYEAMRLGAAMNEQAFRELEDSEGRTCAMGAVLKAATGTTMWTFDTSEWVSWMTCTGPVVCPECSMDIFDLINTVVHLNNDHRWTREQIADWLQPIEDARVVTEPEPVLA